MYLIHNFFTRNIVTVFFLYGLTDFTLGLAVLLKIRQSKLKLVKALPWLSAFGLIHATHEWLEMYQKIYPGLRFNVIHHTFLLLTILISSISILIFGLILLYYYLKNKGLILTIAGVLLFLWLIAAFSIRHPNITIWIRNIEIISRYLFYFTGFIFSAIALLFVYQEIKKEREYKISRYFLYAAILFFIAAPFVGLFTEQGNIFPATIINIQIFFKSTGFPIQLLRGALSILITIFLIRGLDIFNIEEEKKVKNLRDRERAALDKSEKLAKQYSIMYQKEKHISTTLQKALMPLKIPILEDYSIGVHYRSATIEASVGGDFYDFMKTEKEDLYITVGDVSGKGIKAATDTGNVKSIMRYLFISESNPSKIISKLNNALFEEYKASKFFTLILIHYNIKNHLITIVNAGHPPPLCYNRQKDSYKWLRESGAALAVIKDEHYPSTVIKANECDLLLFYTDGLLEARKNGNFFGETGVKTAIKSLRDHSAQSIADNLVREAVNYSGNILFDDVLTLTMKSRKNNK